MYLLQNLTVKNQLFVITELFLLSNQNGNFFVYAIRLHQGVVFYSIHVLRLGLVRALSFHGNMFTNLHLHVRKVKKITSTMQN